MARVLLALGLLVAIAALFWFFAFSPQSPRARSRSGSTTPQPAAAPELSEPSAAAASGARVAAPSAPGRPEPAEPSPAEEPPAAVAAESSAPQQKPLPPPQRSGPVDELREAFERDNRPSSAAQLERKIEAAFGRSEIPAGMLRSVVCRQTVCKVEVNWRPEYMQAHMLAFMVITQELGIRSGAQEPIAREGSDEVVQVNVYLPLDEVTEDG